MDFTKITARELKALSMYIDRMRKIEAQVRRINELDCNQSLTPAQEKRRLKLEDEYASIAAREFMLFTEVNRDPRGSALSLHDSYKEIESGMGVTL